MPLRKDWPCWEIMKCKPENMAKCTAFHSDKPCWEAMREMDVCSYNICKDCLVYVTKQKDSILSQEEILSIMCQKGVDVLGNERCKMYQSYTKAAE